MPHVYPEITSPGLRHRMAAALNQNRRDTAILIYCGAVMLAKMVRRNFGQGCLAMARLEQALDDEQVERIKTWRVSSLTRPTP